MNLIKRILSALLAVTMILGTLSVLLVLPVSAASAESSAGIAQKPDIEDYMTHVFNTPEEKLETMEMMYSYDGYELYVDDQSGEVAVKETATGNILFTNPYDVAASKGSSTVTDSRVPTMKEKLLSQILITCTDNANNSYTLASYKDSAVNDQIQVWRTKTGVRVEYSVGREVTKRLVPMKILDASFEGNILGPINEAFEAGAISNEVYYQYFHIGTYRDPDTGRYYPGLDTYWQILDINKLQDFLKVEECNEHPVLKDMAVPDTEDNDGDGNTEELWYPVLYIFYEDAVNAGDLQTIEEVIKMYCPDYTFELMEEDHLITGYEGDEESYPMFRLALEYSLTGNGLEVTLPCNGLRYDMSSYRLESLTVLPYMGAGNFLNAGYEYGDGEVTEGYNFFPDGAGALFDHGEMANTDVTYDGYIYGEDYAYQTLYGLKFQKPVRYPVYGTVSSEIIYNYTYVAEDEDGNDTDPVTVRVSNTVKTKDEIMAELEAMNATLLSGDLDKTAEVYQRGYVAIVEAADALATKFRMNHEGARCDYSTVYNYFNPKPKDTYKLSDSISATASGGTMTVVSDRKYTGDITLRYFLLCDENRAEAAKVKDATYTHYAATWFGMAEAYRDYLYNNGILTELKASDLLKDLPVYIEVFGAIETQQTIATIPVKVMTPLTTFGNVLDMYGELYDYGIQNINFKLTGFANGGMYYPVPSSLKWEDSVGGNNEFKALIEAANAINAKDGEHVGIYPDFDFAYIQKDDFFDALNLDDDAVKGVDDRYTSLRKYSPTTQTFVTFYQLVISPSRYSKFYTQLLSNYEQYGLKNMSVASLGTALNSDFDEEDPYTRNDSKEFTKQAFSDIKAQGYSLMTDGGNVYTWEYVDHILNVELDSSRYINACATVPFIGSVLHGYVQFAGTPINEEGNANYAMLRAIENGANLYFILSYQNTTELKTDSNLNQYYSIRYDIWLEDVAKYYNELNTVLGDVQTKRIINHQFLKGERIYSLNELEQEIASKLENAVQAELDKIKDTEIKQSISVADAWYLMRNAEKDLAAYLRQIKSLNASVAAAYAGATANADFAAVMQGAIDAYDAIADAEQALADANQAAKDALAAQKALPSDASEADKTAAADAVAAAQAAAATARENVAASKEAYAAAISAVSAQLSQLRSEAVDLITLAVELDAVKAKADALYSTIDQAIETVETTLIYEDDEETRQKLLAQMREWKQAVENGNYYADILKAYETYTTAEGQDYLNEGSELYVINVLAAAVEQAFTTDFAEGGQYVAYTAVNAELQKACAKDLFDADDMNDLRRELEEQNANNSQGSNDKTDDSAKGVEIDNNQIVLVTYGDRDQKTHEKTPYKSLILNYNNFAVRVEYEGVVYTIESGDYVVIYH
ncbi:MAG: hypothetical protein IJX13_03900 [Clostridia bacterium]|nr:hypothetical protein [Clostridia bacterium]